MEHKPKNPPKGEQGGPHCKNCGEELKWAGPTEEQIEAGEKPGLQWRTLDGKGECTA